MNEAAALLVVLLTCKSLIDRAVCNSTNALDEADVSTSTSLAGNVRGLFTSLDEVVWSSTTSLDETVVRASTSLDGTVVSNSTSLDEAVEARASLEEAVWNSSSGQACSSCT